MSGWAFTHMLCQTCFRRCSADISMAEHFYSCHKQDKMNSLGGDKMDKTCGILFSGGLDSSLAVCEMIENGYGAYLFHYDTGALISNNLVDIRYKELKEVYGNKILDMCHYKIGGMFRKLALVSMEEDIKKYNVSLI